MRKPLFSLSVALAMAVLLPITAMAAANMATTTQTCQSCHFSQTLVPTSPAILADASPLAPGGEMANNSFLRCEGGHLDQLGESGSLETMNPAVSLAAENQKEVIAGNACYKQFFRTSFGVRPGSGAYVA